MKKSILASLLVLASSAFAIPQPEWFSSGVIYQISLRTFTRGGDFKSAEEMLPYVVTTGANIVYLTPFVTMDTDADRSGWSHRQIASGFDSPKNPYRIADYAKVDPEYGTEKDLKSFVNRAHELGLKVMFDLVYLHAGPNNVIAKEIPDAFARNEDGSVKTTVWHFPYLNFKSQAVREYLFANMEHFVKDIGCDAFRCDVGDEVPEDFWNEAFVRMRKIKPDFVGLNEGIKPSHVRRAFNANYSWDWSYAMRDAVLAKPGRKTLAERIRSRLEYEAKCPPDALMAVFVENHDLATDSAKNRLDAKVSVEAGNAAYAALFLSRGVPVVWNGNEIADDGEVSFFGPVEHPARCARTVDWSNALTARGMARLATIRKLAKLRRETPALAVGTMKFVENTCPGRVLSFVRTAPDGKRVLVFVNLSPASAAVRAEGISVDLDPWQYAIR